MRLAPAPRTAIVLLALASLSFASPRAETALAQSSPLKVKKVAIVVPASKADQGWNQQGPDSLERVAKKLGLEVQVAENAGYGDIKPILRDLAQKNFDLIICHASGYQTVCPEFAKESKVKVAVVENPKAAQGGLVGNVETLAHEAAYLAGVLAGRVTGSGVVGIVVSAEPPTWNFMSVGFAEGLRSARPNAKLLYGVVGQAAYEDAAGAKRLTEAQIGQRADVIFGQGDGASFGMMSAVAERSKRGGKAWFIDVIGDKRATDKDKILLTSVLFDYAGVYERMIKDIEGGSFGKTYTMDVRNDGVRLLPYAAGTPSAAQAAVTRARLEVTRGTTKVSAIADAPAARARLRQLFPGSIR